MEGDEGQLSNSILDEIWRNVPTTLLDVARLKTRLAGQQRLPLSRGKQKWRSDPAHYALQERQSA